MLADLVDFTLEREPVEAGKRKRNEQADAPVENEECITKRALDLLRRALHCRGIGNVAADQEVAAALSGRTLPRRLARRRRAR